MTAYTSNPTTVSIANAAIRSGFSSHTGLMAAGFLIQRTPGSTVNVAPDTPGESPHPDTPLAAPWWPGPSTRARPRRAPGALCAQTTDSGPRSGVPRPLADGLDASAWQER